MLTAAHFAPGDRKISLVSTTEAVVHLVADGRNILGYIMAAKPSHAFAIVGRTLPPHEVYFLSSTKLPNVLKAQN